MNFHFHVRMLEWPRCRGCSLMTTMSTYDPKEMSSRHSLIVSRYIPGVTLSICCKCLRSPETNVEYDHITKPFLYLISLLKNRTSDLYLSVQERFSPLNINVTIAYRLGKWQTFKSINSNINQYHHYIYILNK